MVNLKHLKEILLIKLVILFINIIKSSKILLIHQVFNNYAIKWESINHLLHNLWQYLNLLKSEERLIFIKIQHTYIHNLILLLDFGYHFKMPQFIMDAYGDYKVVIMENSIKDPSSLMEFQKISIIIKLTIKNLISFLWK